MDLLCWCLTTIDACVWFFHFCLTDRNSWRAKMTSRSSSDTTLFALWAATFRQIRLFLASLMFSNCSREDDGQLRVGQDRCFPIRRDYRIKTSVKIPSHILPNKHGIHPILFQCWASVEDGGPTLIQHWVNASCLLVSMCSVEQPFTQWWINVGSTS